MAARLDETRERFDWRCDGQFVADLFARDEFSERGAHVGFVEHALHEVREAHRHLAELTLDPAAREQRTEDVELLLQTHLLATAEVAEGNSG